MKIAEIITSVLFFIVAGLVFYLSRGFNVGDSVAFSPAFWPRLLASMLFILSAIFLIQTLIKHKDEFYRFEKKALSRVVRMCFLLGVFSVVLVFFGFFISSLVLVPLAMLILGERRIPLILTISVAVPVFVYVIFELILNLQLPKGYFFN